MRDRARRAGHIPPTTVGSPWGHGHGLAWSVVTVPWYIEYVCMYLGCREEINSSRTKRSGVEIVHYHTPSGQASLHMAGINS